ncbi:LOG family protein [Candidatus Woesearchaeota archaeon]|nr:LOG family protein [Candidatus Woesearchaeota archaeon]
MKKVNKNNNGAEKKMQAGHFRVTIFGSARIQKDDPRYHLVYTLAKMIAKEDLDIVTGGGPGLMDAASEGHRDGRKWGTAEHIGLTIQLPKEQRDSVHLDIKRHFSKFSERLDTFIQLSNVVVVAPGGIGTILELFYTWQLIQVGHTYEKPIILLGKHWPGLITWMKKEILGKKMVDKGDFRYLFTVNTATEAMDIINETHKRFLKGEYVTQDFKEMQ